MKTSDKKPITAGIIMNACGLAEVPILDILNPRSETVTRGEISDILDLLDIQSDIIYQPIVNQAQATKQAYLDIKMSSSINDRLDTDPAYRNQRIQFFSREINNFNRLDFSVYCAHPNNDAFLQFIYNKQGAVALRQVAQELANVHIDAAKVENPYLAFNQFFEKYNYPPKVKSIITNENEVDEVRKAISELPEGSFRAKLLQGRLDEFTKGYEGPLRNKG